MMTQAKYGTPDIQRSLSLQSQDDTDETFTGRHIVAIIGSPGAGKTSLISRFKKLPYQEEHVVTIGVELSGCMEPDGQFPIYDAAGQERFIPIVLRMITKPFTTYIVAINLKEYDQSCEAALQWLKHISERGEQPGTKFVIVGTKLDLIPASQISNLKSNLQSFAKDCSASFPGLIPKTPQVFITSAKTGVEVAEVFQHIAKMRAKSAELADQKNRFTSIFESIQRLKKDLRVCKSLTRMAALIKLEEALLGGKNARSAAINDAVQNSQSKITYEELEDSLIKLDQSDGSNPLSMLIPENFHKHSRTGLEKIPFIGKFISKFFRPTNLKTLDELLKKAELSLLSQLTEVRDILIKQDSSAETNLGFSIMLAQGLSLIPLSKKALPNPPCTPPSPSASQLRGLAPSPAESLDFVAASPPPSSSVRPLEEETPHLR